MSGVVATIPSPTQGVWQLGPFPVRAYALCILAGIVVAIWLSDRRWQARGGRPGAILDVAAWAVPFGIVGGRLYHVASSWQPYFGPGGQPLHALYVWQGGLGIWGAVALGGVGAYIAARRQGILLPPLADALAPGIVLAQAIGRLGNYFNNELYGGPTNLPWGLQIHQWDTEAGHAVAGPNGAPIVLGTFHPTFLYELLWDAAVAVVLILLSRRFRFGHGRLFALYVLLYTIGRLWIEALRVDPANHVLGLRLNIWTSILVGLGALIYIVVSLRLRPGQEESLLRPSARAALAAEEGPDAAIAVDASGGGATAEAGEKQPTGGLPGEKPGEAAPAEKSVAEKSEAETPVAETPVAETSVAETSVGETSVGEPSADESAGEGSAQESPGAPAIRRSWWPRRRSLPAQSGEATTVPAPGGTASGATVASDSPDGDLQDAKSRPAG